MVEARLQFWRSEILSAGGSGGIWRSSYSACRTIRCISYGNLNFKENGMCVQGLPVVG